MDRRPKTRSKRVIKVGDSVLIRYGDRDVHGVVLEDRGFIGMPPRRYLYVSVRLLHVTPDHEFEIAEDHLRRAPRRAKGRKSHSSEASTAEP